MDYRQHRVTKVPGYAVLRRSVDIHGYDGYFQDVPHQLQMLDLDGVFLPDDMSVVANPEACILWAVDHLLPPEFREASFVYQLSASAGLTKQDNELNVHLWFFTNREYWDEDLQVWARWWNAKQHRKIIDPAVFTAVQPHYTNEPELLEGLVDPLAGRRLGLIRRHRRTVRLYMPTEQEVAAELGLRQKRAISHYRVMHKNEVTAGSEGSPPEDDSEAGPEARATPESGRNSLSGGAYFDAVRLGPGWRGYLIAVGFEGHIRTQIRAAIGSYFYEYGSRGDRVLLRADIEKAIKESPFLDCGMPWSRRRQEALDYLSPASNSASNVDEMISDIAALQKAVDRRALEACDPTWELPTLTADEAFNQLDEAVCKVVTEALELRRRRTVFGRSLRNDAANSSVLRSRRWQNRVHDQRHRRISSR